MSLCCICKYYQPVNAEDDVANATPLNACNAPVARRHRWLRFFFGKQYCEIFSKEFLYPCDLYCNCYYYKKRIEKYNFGAL